MDDTTRGIDDAGATRRVQPARGASSASGRNTKAKRGSADADLDKDAEARTRELEAEIAETREDLSETVEAIQEKLRPSHMVSEGTEALKTAATERVRDMADSATYTAHRVAESTRENLVPAVLIGTGVAWLLLDRSRDNQTFSSGRYRKGTYQAGRNQVRGYRSRAGESGRYGTGGYEGSASTSRTFAADRDDAFYVRGNSDSAERIITNARTGLQRMLHDNPLLVAAGAVLMGAAVGGALPQTEKENELMGEARDQIVERAQGAAKEAADSVRDVASAVQQVATRVSDPGQH